MSPHRLPALLTAVTLATFSRPASGQVCLQYEPARVRLEGLLAIRAFPGPPNYQDTTTGDVSERAAILTLTTPICVETDSTSDDIAVPEHHVAEVQMVLDPVIWEDLSDYIGPRVLVDGTLFHSITGHHRTRVLITVSKLSIPRGQ